MLKMMSLALLSAMALIGFGADKAAAKPAKPMPGDGAQKDTVKSTFEDHGGCHCTAIGGVRG